MKRISAVLLAVVVVLGSVQSAQAQAKSAYLFGSAGVTLPMGDYGDYAKTGWLGSAGLGYNLTDNAFIGGEAMYGSNKHEVTGDKTDLMGFGGYAGYGFGKPGGGSKVIPYLIGGVGILNHKFIPASGASESEWKLMFSGGGGLFFPMGTAGLFLETRYLKRGDTGFMPIMAGFTVGI